MRNTLIATTTLALALPGCGRANYANTASYDANPGIHYDTGFDASFDAPRPDAPHVDAPSDAFVLADAAFDAGFDAPPDATFDAPPDAFVVPPDAFVIAPCSPVAGTPLGSNMDFELGDTGAWTGDLHADVIAEMGITPRAGSKMLRVLGTTPSGGGGANFDYVQHLSLASFRPQIDSGSQRFVFNVNVNRVPVASNAAYVFLAFYDSAGGLITTRGYSDVAPFRVDADVATWECIQVAGMVPASTDSVDLQISWAMPDLFGQYYDDAAFVLP